MITGCMAFCVLMFGFIRRNEKDDNFNDINGNILLCQTKIGATGNTYYVDNEIMKM